MDQVDATGQVITLIHFVFQVDPERIACMPNMKEFHLTPYHPNYQRSNDPRAVTCRLCKETGDYVAHVARLNAPEPPRRGLGTDRGSK